MAIAISITSNLVLETEIRTIKLAFFARTGVSEVMLCMLEKKAYTY